MTAERRVSLFDNTRISAFKVCPRYFYFAHVRHWQPEEKSPALAFGAAWHEGQDVLWRRAAETLDKKKRKSVIEEIAEAFTRSWIENGMLPPDEMSPDDIEMLGARTPQNAIEMYYDYMDAREHIFSDPSFKVISIERPFAVPLSPDDPTLFYIGRLDKEFSYRNQTLCAEHKTTTSYKRNGPFRNDFIDQFSVSSQIDGYIYALRMEHGDKAAGVWIDGTLVHKSERGSKFIPESRSDEQLDSWLWETFGWLDGIFGNLAALAERKDDDTDYLPAFPRNTNSCTQYGRCRYLDICRVVANPEKLPEPPLGYKTNPWSPFSTIKLEKLGFKVENTTEPLKAAP